MPERLELEDAGRLAAREHRVRLLVVERDARRCRGRRSARTPCRSRRGCAGRGSPSSAGRAPRRSSPRTASRLPGRRPSAGAARSRSAARRRSRRRRRGSSLRASALERRARSTISFATGSESNALLQLGAGLEALVERLARAFRDQLRDLVDDPVRHLEHAAGVAHGGARGHGRERDDLRDAVAAVLLGDVVDDALAARRRRSRCRCRASTCGPGSGSARRAGRSGSGRGR